MSDDTGHTRGHRHWRTALLALVAGVALAIGVLARRRDQLAPGSSRPFDWAESDLDVRSTGQETGVDEQEELEVASFLEPAPGDEPAEVEAVTAEHAVFDWEPVAEEHAAVEAATVEDDAVWPAEPELEPEAAEPVAVEDAPAEPETAEADAVEDPADERPLAPVFDLPPGRVRRLVGSSAAVLALGLTLGAGVVVTSAVAGDMPTSTAPDAGAAGGGAPSNGSPMVEPGTATDGTGTDATTTTTDTTATTTTTTDQGGQPGGVTTTTPTDTTTTDTTATTTTSTDPSATATDPATGAPVDTQSTTADDRALRGTDNPGARRPGSGPDQTTASPKAPAPSHPLSPKTATASPAASSTTAEGSTAVAQPTFTQATTPAQQAALLALPSQFRFYVRASRIQALPKLRRVDNRTMVRLILTAQRQHVAWPVLAAVAKQESNLGRSKGPLAGRQLTDAQFAQYAVDANRNGVVSRSDPADSLSALAGFLRAHGATGKTRNPRTSQHALRLYWGSKARAQRTVALAAFSGALGVGGMQHGLRWDTSRLQRRVLRDHRVSIYPGGRNDVRAGRIDTRVLMTIEYLANASGKVRVSSLVSGHSLFTSSGQVSANVYGRAVDVSAVGGHSVAGHQGPGTVTDRTVRLLLMLPKSVRPRQVISLMDLDGPTGNTGSFALPSQTQSIHIGY
jgi:hypothetical protein